jgi:hypothetical protein
MQQLWHCMVNVSFGYLALIATVRILQETNALVRLYRKRERVTL